MVVTTICMKLMVEVYNLENSEKYQVRYHDSCVLSLKYAHKNDWFISTGKDQIINGSKSPYAANIISSISNLYKLFICSCGNLYANSLIN